MGNLGNEFDANTVAPATGASEPVPAGDYLVVITDSEVVDNKNQNGKIAKLTMQVVEGQYQGRKIFDNLNIANPNAKAVEIAKATLSAYCHAVGKLRVTDTSELHNTPFVVKVNVKADPGYEPKNNVRKISPANGTAPSAPAQNASPAQAAPAQGGASGAPAWQR